MALVIVVGLPAAGKSSLSNCVERLLNEEQQHSSSEEKTPKRVVVFSFDEFLIRSDPNLQVKHTSDKNMPFLLILEKCTCK